MYIVKLNFAGDYKKFGFNRFNDAIDCAIKNHRQFSELTDSSGTLFYNRINADGIGGYDLMLECERLG